MDTKGVWATFDFALHESGHFDAITNRWLHIALAVSSTRASVCVDGKPTPSSKLGFFIGAMQSTGNVSVAPYASLYNRRPAGPWYRLAA